MVRPMSETLRDLLLSKRVADSNDVFAVRAGISPRGLAKLLAGAVGSPRRATVLALARALKVPADRVTAAIAASRAAAQ